MLKRGIALAVFAAALALGLLAQGGAVWAQDAPNRGGGLEGELPRGGKSVFPQHRVVGFYGAPQSPQLGELGIGSPDSAARRLEQQARPYNALSSKKLLPVFELLGTIALANPGQDGLYRARQTNTVIRRYANEAREERFLLMLDIQPGRSNFMTEAKHLEPWLKRSFVSIALDPEWNMGPSGVPGERIGSVDASMVNKVTAYLSKLIRDNDLPQKLVVIHQFTDGMVKNKQNLKVHRNIDLVLNADGFGTPSAKRSKYEELAPSRSSGIYPGFKLFYEEDTNLMSPGQVMGLNPQPKIIVYE
jgi:hypothetical protein